ncbi:hypothetical protein [Clostridium botulinum]|uniref:hypothetical protein n=1 Tax=Clostridium botulinum TaxID=1491 RepID=UPI000B272509|nr:hypothetical protein [Clostridium botulinum]MBY6934515.1 hypothetical protein [Clostridium botulinum]
MKERKVIEKEVEESLVNTVVDFASKEGLTVLNVKEAMEKVYKYFEGNSVLEKVAEV